MNAPELISFGEVHASKQWNALRQQLHKFPCCSRCGRPWYSPCNISPGPLACSGSTRHGLPALARLTLLEPSKMVEDCLEGTGVPRLPGQHLGPHEPVHGLRLPAQLGGTASGT